MRVGDEPPEPWDGSTVRVRFRAARRRVAAGERHRLGEVRDPAAPRPGHPAKARCCGHRRGPTCLVATNDRHTLTKRRVEIGSIVYGYAAVVSGLKEDEWVVAMHTFTLDTARRLGWRALP